MQSQPDFDRCFYMLVIAWIGVFFMSVAFIASEVQGNAENQAFIRAKSIAERDMLYRQWAGHYGGVYLPHVESIDLDQFQMPGHDSEVVTEDGLQLHLVSSASMTRQVFELGNSGSDFISRITSLDVTNPDKQPDMWQSEALTNLKQTGAESFSAIALSGDVEYARTLFPLKVEQGCLDCHVDEGYQPGDIRGGISILIPFHPFLEAEWEASRSVLMLAALFWLAGFFGIFFFSRKLSQQFQIISESEQQRHIAESTLHYLAHFDKQTNLPKRALFEDRLHQAIVYAGRTERKVAVAVVKIDNFNKLCDVFSERGESELIRRFAEVVSSIIRPDDTIARFEKDSLLILLPGMRSKEGIVSIFEKINYQLEAPFLVDQKELFINSSVGVALYPDDTDDADTLVRYAETAAQTACSLEGATLQMYSEELNRSAHERLFLETGIRKALIEDQFTIYYQPQIDAPSGRIVGAEALIRWQQPGRGLVSPASFIPLAAETGLILPMGEWVLRDACTRVKEWREQGLEPGRISVNIAGKQLQSKDFLGRFQAILQETGCRAEWLELEVTEGFVMEQAERSINLLLDLRDLGVELAIDDFGTGYSSLSYLKHLPFTKLKIDQSFVRDIPQDANDMAIARAVGALGKSLGLKVIAEGVETGEQEAFLKSEDCDEVQGYLYSRPVPAQEFIECLKGRK